MSLDSFLKLLMQRTGPLIGLRKAGDVIRLTLENGVERIS
jgi:hypothetical protein